MNPAAPRSLAHLAITSLNCEGSGGGGVGPAPIYKYTTGFIVLSSILTTKLITALSLFVGLFQGSCYDRGMESWRNRIVGTGEVDPEDLLANPLNWRIHPQSQQEALETVIDEVGWVSGIIVNERTGFVIDGHLRIALALRREEKLVPVQYVDLDEREERLVLATLDPIGTMAGTDMEQLERLLGGFQDEADEIRKLVAKVAEGKGVPIRTELPPSEVCECAECGNRHRRDL